MTDHLDAGLTAPFKSGDVWIRIDLFHTVEGGENIDNDELYDRTMEWLENVDAEELKAKILGENNIDMERWD